MLHTGLDLSTKRLGACVLDDAGERVATTLCPPGADGPRHLVAEVSDFSQPVMAAIESMNGARFVHETLELLGWDSSIRAVEAGSDEPLNNLIKRIKRIAFGFRNFENYRIRALLYAGKPNWWVLGSIVVR